MTMIRKPAVAGAFYPADPSDLEEMIESFLEINLKGKPGLKGVICPHAGYIYSGPTAGYSYKLLSNLPDKKYNVFLLGLAHTTHTSASVENYDSFKTPLGNAKVNKSICEELLKNDRLEFIPESQSAEHSLEVQIPFLQKTLKQFELIPIVLGDISPDYISEILQPYFNKEDSLFVISSDLSHYEPYDTAKQIDKNSLDIITSLKIDEENQIDACGNMGIKVMMRLAKNNNYKIELLDYRNSGDTAGDKNGVVGYAALAVYKE
jgi:AmmeMemoRadiSam system protein B